MAPSVGNYSHYVHFKTWLRKTWTQLGHINERSIFFYLKSMIIRYQIICIVPNTTITFRNVLLFTKLFTYDFCYLHLEFLVILGRGFTLHTH